MFLLFNRIKLKMKNYNMKLTEKQQKYQLDHMEKLINTNILEAKKYYHLNRVE